MQDRCTGNLYVPEYNIFFIFFVCMCMWRVVKILQLIWWRYETSPPSRIGREKKEKKRERRKEEKKNKAKQLFIDWLSQISLCFCFSFFFLYRIVNDLTNFFSFSLFLYDWKLLSHFFFFFFFVEMRWEFGWLLGLTPPVMAMERVMRFWVV